MPEVFLNPNFSPRPWGAPALARRGLLLAGSGLVLAGGRRAQAQDQRLPEAMRAMTGLGEVARARGISFGAAMLTQLLQRDPAYEAAFATEAAVIVPEWEGKFAALQPEEGRFDTAPLDAQLHWAQQRGRTLRGHALIWHESLPGWAERALAEGRDRALGVMAAHFDRVLNHARGQIRDWDVVNEPIATAGDRLRDTPWLRALGPDYIDIALRMARERDPTLRLVLNEYGFEEEVPEALLKRQQLLALLRGLLERKVPLDALGIQGHLHLSRPFNAASFAGFLAEVRALGLQVLVTELDIRETWDAPQEIAARDALVAERTYAFVSTALEGGARTVLSWGLSDRNSWLASTPAVAMGQGRVHRGLPLDDHGQRKPMWQALARAFRGGS
ncbi:endo-1,4-beta-xylanase [Roseomonas sp. USHLN139]|uniref:endo-1,4-beta-xylanase n=1 Tax=Roseomonas sp. USHLN139 TaxID=3081298 RepID=UPI003B02858F